jgi:hypothetical protein
MKKITLVLVALAFAVGIAGAEDVILSVSGSADIEWGFEGQLIDNTGSFLDESVPYGDFYTDGPDDGFVNMDVPAFTMMMSVEDADGNVIVEAAANEIALDDNGSTTFEWEEEFAVTLDYISFPNVVPGLLGITLEDDDALEPDYAPFGSASSNERILVDITPIDQLDVQVGLLIKPDNRLYTTFYDAEPALLVDGDPAATTGLFTWPDDGDYSDLDDFDDFDPSVTLADNPWESGTYLSFAASLEATFTQELNDEDSISVGLGTVYDTAYFNDSYEPDYKVDGTDEQYSVFTDDAEMNDDLTQAVIAEVYGPIAVNPLTMEDENPTLFDAASTDEPKMLRTNEVRGRATIPFGLGVTADVAGLSAAVDFQTALTQGLAEDNLTGTIDLVDETKSTFNWAEYSMPIYAAVDLAYELEAGDMTITPGLNFKYCSDYWKWYQDSTDADDDDYYWDYDGDVSSADYVGRPMSLDASVDVEGIAGMIDVSVSANLGFGDGAANHGYGYLVDPMGLDPLGVTAMAALMGWPTPSYTITHDTGVAETIEFDNTLADLIDFWYVQPTEAEDDANYWTALDPDKPAEAADDGLNNRYLPNGTNAMGISVGITVTPLDGLSISNTTDYTVDNLGIGMGDDDDNLVLFGVGLSTLTNETVVEYEWMVGDVVAFTLFGDFTYESMAYDTEMGQKYVGLRTDADPAGITDLYEFGYSEAPSMATFEYAIGVKCSVGLDTDDM